MYAIARCYVNGSSKIIWVGPSEADALAMFQMYRRISDFIGFPLPNIIGYQLLEIVPN